MSFMPTRQEMGIDPVSDRVDVPAMPSVPSGRRSRVREISPAVLAQIAAAAAQNRESWTGRAVALVAATIARVVPSRLQYWAAYRVARLVALVVQPFRRGRNRTGYTAILLHRLLDALYQRASPPAPLLVLGQRYLDRYLEQAGGFLVVSGHLPCIKLPASYIAKAARSGRSVRITSVAPVQNGLVTLWGQPPVQAIFTDGNAMLRIRGVLAQGGVVMNQVDDDGQKYFSGNTMRLAARTGTPILTTFAEILPDGRPCASYLPPPFPIPRDEAQVQANLQFIHRMVAAILGNGPKPAAYDQRLSAVESGEAFADLPPEHAEAISPERSA
jgi:hypothetical protein